MKTELLAVIVAILVHAGAFVWWASKINTLVTLIVNDVRELKAAAADPAQSAAGRAIVERLRLLEKT